MLALTAITSVTSAIVTLGSGGAVPVQLAQAVSPGRGLGTVLGCRFQSNCSPPPPHLRAEMGADAWAQGASREPHDGKPRSGASPLQT